MDADIYDIRKFRAAILNQVDCSCEYSYEKYKEAAEAIVRARVKDFASEDLDYFVNEALFQVYRKMDLFDPAKGTFRAFFNRIVGNSVFDTREELKPESIRSIDRSIREATDSEKKALLEKMRVAFVRIEALGTSSLDSVTDEDMSVMAAKRRHLEEGLDKVKEYVDLQNPEIKRMLYSSLGSVLEPAEYVDAHKKGYAEELASVLGTTKEVVSQIVFRKKQEAIRYANNMGYDSKSLRNVTGFMTTSQQVDFDINKYSQFEQFMIFRTILKDLQENTNN